MERCRRVRSVDQWYRDFVGGVYNPDGVAAEWRVLPIFKRTKKFGESYFIKLEEVSERAEERSGEKAREAFG